MDEAGIDRSVVFPFGPATQEYKKINEEFTRHLKNPRFIPFGRVNHLSQDAVNEVERIHAHGFKGIKIHTRPGPVTAAPEVFKAIEKTDLPVIIHTGIGEHDHPAQLDKLNFSGRLIIGHGGKSLAHIAGDLLKKHDNYYAETSIQSAYQTLRLISTGDPEKIMIGSDSPFNHPKNELLKLKHLEDLGRIDSATRTAILGGNFKKHFADLL